jgi:hypothetical protein
VLQDDVTAGCENRQLYQKVIFKCYSPSETNMYVLWSTCIIALTFYPHRNYKKKPLQATHLNIS